MIEVADESVQMKYRKPPPLFSIKARKLAEEVKKIPPLYDKAR